MENLEFFFNLVKSKIYHVSGLILGVFILGYFLHSHDSSVKAIVISLNIRLLLYVIVILFWTLVWSLNRNYFPQAKTDKIGLVISIDAENKKQKERIKKDFAQGLFDNLASNNLSSMFDLVVLSDYRATKAIKILNDYCKKKIETPSQEGSKEYIAWEKFRKKVNGHFFIFGNVIERKDKENKYFLKMDGLVVHKPISVESSNDIAKEFLTIFPKRISFYENFEVKGFSFAANTVYLSIRYMTGMAALMSGDVITAHALHQGLKEQLTNFSKPLPPNIKHVLTKLNEMLSAEKHLLALYYYGKNDLKKARHLIGECLELGVNLYDPLIMKSIIAFKDDRSPFDALKLLNKARKHAKSDYTWLYNKAFILMYIEKFDRAKTLYRKLAEIKFYGEESIVEQCIGFNQELLEYEPSKIQSLFIIAYLYWKKKENLPLALDYFEQFIEKSQENETYEKLNTVAAQYLANITNQMNLN